MKNKGFSLIELIIVLLLISLSVSLVTPSLGRLSKAVQLKGATKKVSAILRYYRSEAVNKGKVYQVLFDSDLREVRVQLLESTEVKGGDEKKEENPLQKKYSLPDGIQIKEVKVDPLQYGSDIPTVEFYPNGGSNGGAILIESLDHKGYRIKVHFLTGIVVIEEV